MAKNNFEGCDEDKVKPRKNLVTQTGEKVSEQ